MRGLKFFTVALAVGAPYVTLGARSALGQAQGVASEPPAEELPPHGYVITNPMPGSEFPVDYTFVYTKDEIYVPISVRKPKGEGPFPAILTGSGNGARGMKAVEEQTEKLGSMHDEMVRRGYVVAYAEYRNEIPYLYEELDAGTRAQNLGDNISGGQRVLKSTPTLDSDDFISILKYLQSLPYVDEDAVGAFGVSHSGELIMKAAAEYKFAAGVPNEGASHEFLHLDTGPKAPRIGTEMQFRDVATVKKFMKDPARAKAQIANIQTPILHLGRDDDHLQGIFLTVHEMMLEAGKDSTWVTFDHPDHGYAFIRREKDGSYQPDPIQKESFEIVMSFFDKHMKHSHATNDK